MLRHRLLIFFISIFSALDAIADQQSISVIIPCYWRHFQYVEGLLTSICEQTVLPNEVVISLSQAELLPSSLIDDLEARRWPFELRILRRNGYCSAGNNRSAAARACRGAIVSSIDADDVPHRQRLEAVRKAFQDDSRLAMVLTGHAYCFGKSVSCCSAIPWFAETDFINSTFDLNSMNISRLRSLRDLQRWDTTIHNGAPSFKRHILSYGISWSDRINGEDQEFNLAVIRHALKDRQDVGLIQLPLLLYMNARTSGPEFGRKKHL
jgi:cellulose synthase/poly-beta-1,6-N-acetylglucosamine synthase-like glycosyltransferase